MAQVRDAFTDDAPLVQEQRCDDRATPLRRQALQVCQWGTKLTLVRASAVLLAVVGALALARIAKSNLVRASAEHAMSAVAVVPRGHHIVSATRNVCLARTSNHRGAFITTSPCEDSNENQIWVFATNLGHIATPQGECMDDGGQFVHIWDCSLGKFQQNQHVAWSGEKYIKNTQGHCLHAGLGNGKVGFGFCDGSPDLEWKLAPPDRPTAAPSRGNLPTQRPMTGKKLIKQGGFCLHGGTVHVHLRSCADVTSDGVWEQDPSTMQLRSASGRCLDAASDALRAPCDESNANQQWYVNEHTGHVYTTASGFQCLAASRPQHNGDIVGLRPCDPLSKGLRWSVHPYDQEFAG